MLFTSEFQACSVHQLPGSLAGLGTISHKRLRLDRAKPRSGRTWRCYRSKLGPRSRLRCSLGVGSGSFCTARSPDPCRPSSARLLSRELARRQPGLELLGLLPGKHPRFLLATALGLGRAEVARQIHVLGVRFQLFLMNPNDNDRQACIDNFSIPLFTADHGREVNFKRLSNFVYSMANPLCKKLQ